MGNAHCKKSYSAITQVDNERILPRDKNISNYVKPIIFYHLFFFIFWKQLYFVKLTREM